MNKEPQELARAVGFSGIYLSVVNITIGSSVFLIPALLAGILGPASIYAYIACGLAILLVMLCFVEMSSRVTVSGGTYSYIQHAFGPYWGFLANTLFWLGVGVIATAALVNGMADMLSVLSPVFKTAWVRGILFLFILGLSAGINVRGIKQGIFVVKTVTLIKILPLLALILAGMFWINGSNYQWSEVPALNSVGEAALILFFAMIGGECALAISGEVKNPRRNAPLGLLAGTSTAILFYCLLHLTAQGVLGTELSMHKEAPLAATAFKMIGGFGQSAIIAAAIVSIFGTLMALPQLFARVIYAGATDGLLPAPLARVHRIYATPTNAIIVFSIIAFILAITGSFKQLAILVSASSILLYLGVALAVIKYRMNGSTESADIIRLPGGITIPVLTIIILFWFLIQLTGREFLSIGILILVASLLYLGQKLAVTGK